MVRQAGQGRLAIVAGSGKLPVHVAEAARGNGEEPLVIAIRGEADGDWSAFETIDLGIGDIAGFKKAARAAGVDRVVLSGGIRLRPAWNRIRLNLATVWKLPGLVRTLMHGGDNLVLTTAIDLIEEEGLRVIGAHEVAPGLVATIGPIGRHRPDRQSEADIRVSIRAARLLGELDIGQGVVAVGGRVVALEGPEGTDAMIARINMLRERGRISTTRRGVLVKLCKPSQDVRVDLPSAGLSTLTHALDAGLAGVALEAGRALLLDRTAAVEFADRNGLFIVGIDPDALEAGR
ncbi:MAG: UDP-2,3-diacylglucosamine diphosphatase LpxI [Rhizobiaceae bacterium]|nr:UDP-2,3-diacylglucosamine diphosphatase LpxI [Rhizobiaceae bacterium]